MRKSYVTLILSIVLVFSACVKEENSSNKQRKAEPVSHIITVNIDEAQESDVTPMVEISIVPTSLDTTLVSTLSPTVIPTNPSDAPNGTSDPVERGENELEDF